VPLLLAVDDNGERFEPSSDPLLEDSMAYLKNIKLGDARDFHEELNPILSNSKIFGVDLYEVGMGKQIESYFSELVAGTGYIRKTLKKYL